MKGKIIFDLVIIGTLSLFINCSNTKVSKVKNVEFNGTDNISLLSCVSEISICPLETSKKCLIGDNPDLRVMDKDYYIIDTYGSKTIYRFNNEGTFLNKIGTVGRGENEYSSMSSVYIHNDSIVLFSGDKKVYSYHKNGEIRKVKSIDYNTGASIVTTDGLWCYLGYNNGSCDERLVRTNPDYLIKDKYLPLKTKAIHLSDANNFYNSNENVFLKESFLNTIYKLSGNKFSPHIVFNFKELGVPKKYFQFEDPFEAFGFLNKKGFISIYRYMEEGITSFVELREQTVDGISTILGVSRNDVWKWFDITKFNNDLFTGVFQNIDTKGNIVGIISADKLLSLYSSNPKLFKEHSLIEKLKVEDNPFVIKIKLREDL